MAETIWIILSLGVNNYGTDPNPTADITGQNGQYISNYTNGSWDFGSANITTTGSLLIGGAGITASSTIRGTHAFTGTSTEDTVIISGAASSDIYFVSSQYNTGVNANDKLEWQGLTGKLVVHRSASGESGGKYSWFRVQ